MSTTVATLRAVLDADTRPFEQAMGRSETRFQKVGRAAGAMGLAIATGLGVVAKVGFDEFEEGQKVAAQTAAVLKSTGGVANVTAGQVDALATSIMRKSGIDDEAIKSGENLLLTFTNVRNEAGKGNDIFTQATSIMADMSTALGQDTSASAIQLGKALNDPIKGVTALQRVGVSFTQKQRDQIAALVESGRTMDAQKLILGELTKEFGGSAEAAGDTFAGKVNIAKETAKNLAGELVAGAIPTLEVLTGALSSAAEFLSKHTTTAKILVGVLAGLAVTLMAVSVATKIAAAAQILLNVAMSANPIGIVVVALAALAVGIMVAWKRSETFRKIVTTAWTVVKDAALTAVAFILTAIDKYLGAIEMILHVMGKLPGPLGAPFRKMEDAVESARERVQGLKDTVESLRSKEIHVKAVVEGLGYVTALQEHLSLIRSQGANISVSRRASGGPVGAGRSYLVGERGPELFVPRMSGTIVPHVATAGAAVYNFSFPNYVGSKDELIRVVRAGLEEHLQRGGA